VRGQVKAARADLARLREKKTRVVQLTRAVDAQHDAFMAYGKRLEEARIAAGLDREQLANVAVIERPHSLVPPSETVAKAGMVGLAALLGIVVALGIAFGAEFFTNALRTREDVEYHLGLPVIAVIPADPRRALPGGRD
jgi:capsular polysaccharide biosynthesis protein